MNFFFQFFIKCFLKGCFEPASYMHFINGAAKRSTALKD